MQKDDPKPQSVEMSIAILKAALEIEKFGIEFYHNFSMCVKETQGAALLFDQNYRAKPAYWTVRNALAAGRR